MKDTELIKWEIATDILVDKFLEVYFKGDYTSNRYWVGGDIGGVFCINDYFFDIHRIVEAFRYKAPVKKFFEYYELEVDYAIKDKPLVVNLRNYLKLKNKKEIR